MQEVKLLNASYFPRNEKVLDSNRTTGYSLHNGLFSKQDLRHYDAIQAAVKISGCECVRYLLIHIYN